jgi:hypothetical protein
MSDVDRLIKAMRAGGAIRISVEQAMPSGLAQLATIRSAKIRTRAG